MNDGDFGLGDDDGDEGGRAPIQDINQLVQQLRGTGRPSQAAGKSKGRSKQAREDEAQVPSLHPDPHMLTSGHGNSPAAHLLRWNYELLPFTTQSTWQLHIRMQASVSKALQHAALQGSGTKAVSSPVCP